MTDSAIISLLFLIATIVIANIKKINIGFTALAAAMILGLLYQLDINTLLSGFNLTLVIRMLAMQSLVVIAASNGTLEYLAGKIKKICRGKILKIFPILLYFLLLLAEIAGFNLYSLMLPVLAAIAFALNMDVLKVSIIGILAMLAGCFSPYSIPGILLYGYVSDAGLEINKWNIPALCMISYSLLFILIYFLYGWHKTGEKEAEEEIGCKISKSYILTIGSYVVVVAANLVFSVDMMMTASICSMILMVLKVAEPIKVVKNIPYPVLLMMGGTTTLIGVIENLGGLELFSSGMAYLINPSMAPPAAMVLSGLMSIFTSASGVVQPTLISSLPHMLEMMPGLNVQSMVIAIAVGSYAVAMGPFDASGAQIMAAYDSVFRPTEQERLKVFNNLIKLMVGILVYQSILVFAGFYKLQIF